MRLSTTLQQPLLLQDSASPDPSFDHRLSQRGYEVRHITEVMTADLKDVSLLKEERREYIFENRLNLPTSFTTQEG